MTAWGERWPAQPKCSRSWSGSYSTVREKLQKVEAHMVTWSEGVRYTQLSSTDQNSDTGTPLVTTGNIYTHHKKPCESPRSLILGSRNLDSICRQRRNVIKRENVTYLTGFTVTQCQWPTHQQYWVTALYCICA
jgi:hypothetical protein